MERYAIYWTPEPGSALASFGAAWFGNGKEQRNTFGLEPDMAERAASGPARYRLHATLKAPFRMHEGAGLAELNSAMAAFCARRRVVMAGPLWMVQSGNYLALTVSPPAAEVDWLAAQCVTWFDRFRAPLNEKDHAKRGDDLTATEIALLETYGYPYVLSAFQFHITLAGPLAKPELDIIENALRPVLTSILSKPFVMESLSLLGDPGGGRQFESLGRHYFMR